MDIGVIVALLIEKFPVAGSIFMLLGALVVIGQVVVAITPSKKDDEVVAKWYSIPVLGQILTILASFAPIQKK